MAEAGFSNGTMYASNVDFSGGFPVTGQVTADGQLLIGSSTAPHIKVGTLTSGTGISVTNSSGGISISTTQSPALIKIRSQTASNSANIIFTSSDITTTYSAYLFTFNQIIPVVGGQAFNMEFSTDNGNTYLNSGYQCGAGFNSWNSSTHQNFSSTTIAQLLNTTIGATAGACGQIYFYGLADSASAQPMYTGQFFVSNQYYSVYGYNSTTPNINNIRFSFTATNINSGTITLYGLV